MMVSIPVIVFIVLIVLMSLIVVISRTIVFPLSAGKIDPGLTAAKNLDIQRRSRELDTYPLVAAIVEPRTDNLISIITHFIAALPAETHFQVYHGTENIGVLHDNFADYIQVGKVSLWNMGVPNLTIQGYSALLTSKEFWNTIQAEKTLIFQTDAITCGQSNFNINDFIEYDFVGAPVPLYINILINILFMGKGYVPGHMRYYNGGLSFRSKSKMLAVIEHYPWDRLCTEDIWFCTFLPRVGGKLPPLEVARSFSFESEKLDHIPWGLHKPRKSHEELCQICPEVNKIPFIPAHTDYRNLYLL